MRRFYCQAGVRAEASGWLVLLDGQPVHTPARRRLIVPTAGLANAIAAEWAQQGESVDLATMHLTRLAGTALDKVGPARGTIVAQTVARADTDLLCYRQAGRPGQRQDAEWQVWLDWATTRFGAFRVTRGLTAVPQPGQSVQALRAALEATTDFQLTVLVWMTGLTGSLLLAMAVFEGQLQPGPALDLGRLEERLQAESWGMDTDNAARASAMAAEMHAAGRFLALLAA